MLSMILTEYPGRLPAVIRHQLTAVISRAARVLLSGDSGTQVRKSIVTCNLLGHIGT